MTCLQSVDINPLPQADINDASGDVQKGLFLNPEKLYTAAVLLHKRYRGTVRVKFPRLISKGGQDWKNVF